MNCAKLYRTVKILLIQVDLISGCACTTAREQWWTAARESYADKSYSHIIAVEPGCRSLALARSSLYALEK